MTNRDFSKLRHAGKPTEDRNAPTPYPLVRPQKPMRILSKAEAAAKLLAMRNK